VETMFELPTATHRLHPIDTQIHKYPDTRITGAGAADGHPTVAVAKCTRIESFSRAFQHSFRLSGV